MPRLRLPPVTGLAVGLLVLCGSAFGVVTVDLVAADEADAAVKENPGTAMRISGDNRFQTAAAIAALVEDPLEEIILVGAEEPATAMVAAPLAVRLAAPVLLSGHQQLPEATLAIIADARPSRATLVGDLSHIGEEVRAELEALGVAVRRIGGPDALATAVAIAVAMDPAPRGEVYLAAAHPIGSAEGWQHTLVAATLAADAGVPLLLTDADELSGVTHEALVQLRPRRVVAVGDTEVLATAVTRAISREGIAVDRLRGSAERIAADQAHDREPRRSGPVFVSSRTSFLDSLVLPAVVARSGGSLVLIDGVDPRDPGFAALSQLQLMSSQPSDDRQEHPTLLVIGGPGAVRPQVATAAARTAGVRFVTTKAFLDLRSGGGDTLVLLAGSVLILHLVVRFLKGVLLRRGPQGHDDQHGQGRDDRDRAQPSQGQQRTA
ncbi:MAG TPA: cell wall-binding repeat-containing protein [Euzebya sp.]|nr:cell wall-binding repeat-containing protein [Euzebya sp.]